ncbi:protein kinase [Streptomyces sp. NPDC127084]|uniref:serine/threonine-protein kinase n=1 Tax=Streptomyces sp. NPDC127084 TaxID=3347133 RepID=UPI003663565F
MDNRGSGRRLVDGRFELLGRLGSGGMGNVWRARDIMLHREVALKEVRPPDAAVQDTDPARAQMLSARVLREAQALARIAHPHVVTIYHIVNSAASAQDVEARSGDAYPWIVMELVRGESLHERLTRGPLGFPEALRVGQGVLSALRAAHAEGIQHRDVKPANVLLRPDGSPVLTDFGIAALRESTSLTATGDLIGSPEYIAPERIRGEEGNPASDLWSLGMLLYVALEGSHPLRRETSLSTLVAVLDEPIPTPVRSGPFAPVLNALLVRNTAARPDAESLEWMLAEAGRGALNGPTAQPPTATTSYPLPPPSTTPSPVAPAVAPPYGTPPAHTPPAYASATNPYATPAVHTPTPNPYPAPSAGTTPLDPFGAQPAAGRRTRRWKAPAGVLGAVAAVTVVSMVALKIGPFGDGGTPQGRTQEPGAASAPAGGTRDSGDSTEGSSGDAPTDTALPPSKETKNLLTASGVRSVIKALEAKTRTTEFVELTVYEEYAFAEIPGSGGEKRKYRYEYRNGYASKQGAGSTMGFGYTGPIDVSKVKWDRLPALIEKAEKELGVKKPTMRYVIVRGPVFDSVPTVNVYLSDESLASGYLAADFDGAVLRTVKAQ